MRQLDELIKRHLAKQEREDFRAGIVCATLANINRDSKKQRKPFTPFDFMPTSKGKKPKKKQTPKQMLQVVKMINAAHGGKVI